MTKEIRGMVDAIADGDLNAANTAFDAALQQKREDAWVNSKHEFARTAFEYPNHRRPGRSSFRGRINETYIRTR